MAYPHKWSPISYKSSAGQRKHIGQRPMTGCILQLSLTLTVFAFPCAGSMEQFALGDNSLSLKELTYLLTYLLT